MNLLTLDETKCWIKSWGNDVDLSEQWPGQNVNFKSLKASANIQPENLSGLAMRLVELLGPCRRAIFVVIQSGIWDEDTFLTHAVRWTSGESTPLETKPGHLLQTHELMTLRTLIVTSVLNGWDSIVVTDSDYGRLFLSHDQWFQCMHQNETLADTIVSQICLKRIDERTDKASQIQAHK